jgi:glutathione S-transferase
VSTFKLYVAPKTCARVATIALEEIGVPFETELIRFPDKQQKSPAYLAVNPKGKVPALVVDGTVITENVSILSWLNETYPDAQLLPKTNSSFEHYLQMADISFVSGTVHPFVTRIAMPSKFAKSEDAIAEVKQAAIEEVRPYAKLIDDRYSRGTWWHGDQWSIMDAYIFWAWTRMVGEGFPEEEYSNVVDLCKRIQERPSVQRAMQRETENIAVMAAEAKQKK